jgi:hypothetical protein
MWLDFHLAPGFPGDDLFRGCLDAHLFRAFVPTGQHDGDRLGILLLQRHQPGVGGTAADDDFPTLMGSLKQSRGV